MSSTDGWKLWLIVASTFVLLVGYQYCAVPEVYVVQHGLAVSLTGATAAAFRQLLALMVPVALVMLAGMTFDRIAPPIPH